MKWLTGIAVAITATFLVGSIVLMFAAIWSDPPLQSRLGDSAVAAFIVGLFLSLGAVALVAGAVDE